MRDLWVKPLSAKAFVMSMLGSFAFMLLLAVPMVKFVAFVPAAGLAGWAMRQRLMALAKPRWIAVIPMLAYGVFGVSWHLVSPTASDLAGISAVVAFSLGAWAGLWVFETGRKMGIA